MSKDLIRGFLLAHNAPGEIMEALNLMGEPLAIRPAPAIPTLDTILDEIYYESGGGRVVNCLRNEGIKSTEDLLKLESRYLLKVPNFGRRSLNIIKDTLAKYNLKLAA